MQVTGSAEIKGILMNKSTLGENGHTTRVPADHNAMLYGPMQIATGSTIVIEEGANLKIKDIQDA
tara:strand:- start:645 stop:839 length:195 start_codon:yes stop_codon:yes gene_type:complete